MNNDCLLCIFNYLSLTGISNCFLVCKQFNNVTNNNLYWKSLTNVDFPNMITNNYKSNYKQHYILNNFLL